MMRAREQKRKEGNPTTHFIPFCFAHSVKAATRLNREEEDDVTPLPDDDDDDDRFVADRGMNGREAQLPRRSTVSRDDLPCRAKVKVEEWEVAANEALQ